MTAAAIRWRVQQRLLSCSQSDDENLALEALLDAKLLIAARQQIQALLHVSGQVRHGDHTVLVGIDVVVGQRVEQDLREGAMLPCLVLARELVRRAGRRNRGSHARRSTPKAPGVAP